MISISTVTIPVIVFSAWLRLQLSLMLWLLGKIVSCGECRTRVKSLNIILIFLKRVILLLLCLMVNPTSPHHLLLCLLGISLLLLKYYKKNLLLSLAPLQGKIIIVKKVENVWDPPYRPANLPEAVFGGPDIFTQTQTATSPISPDILDFAINLIS